MNIKHCVHGNLATTPPSLTWRDQGQCPALHNGSGLISSKHPLPRHHHCYLNSIKIVHQIQFIEHFVHKIMFRWLADQSVPVTESLVRGSSKDDLSPATPPQQPTCLASSGRASDTCGRRHLDSPPCLLTSLKTFSEESIQAKSSRGRTCQVNHLSFVIFLCTHLCDFPPLPESCRSPGMADPFTT